MDPVQESFNAWIEGGGRSNPTTYEFEFYVDDPLEDSVEVDGGSLIYEGGTFKHVVEMEREIDDITKAVDAGQTEEEHYRSLVIPLDDDEPPKVGGALNFKQGLLAMLGTLNLK